jgi:hypothetical protein
MPRRDMTTYRLVVSGRLPSAAERLLPDVGATVVDEAGPATMIEVADQSALVGLLARMHGLGIVIEHVDQVGQTG